MHIQRLCARLAALIIALVPLFAIGVGSVFANTPNGALINPLSTDTLPELLITILDAVIIIAFPVLVLFLVYAGFLFISAQGNESKLSEARKIFVWTLIGAVVVLSAKAISEVVTSTVCEVVTGSAYASLCD